MLTTLGHHVRIVRHHRHDDPVMSGDQVMGEHEEARGLAMALRWKLATIKASSAHESEARAILHRGGGLQITRQKHPSQNKVI